MFSDACTHGILGDAGIAIEQEISAKADASSRSIVKHFEEKRLRLLERDLSHLKKVHDVGNPQEEGQQSVKPPPDVELRVAGFPSRDSIPPQRGDGLHSCWGNRKPADNRLLRCPALERKHREFGRHGKFSW